MRRYCIVLESKSAFNFAMLSHRSVIVYDLLIFQCLERQQNKVIVLKKVTKCLQFHCTDQRFQIRKDNCLINCVENMSNNLPRGWLWEVLPPPPLPPLLILTPPCYRQEKGLVSKLNFRPKKGWQKFFPLIHHCSLN